MSDIDKHRGLRTRAILGKLKLVAEAEASNAGNLQEVARINDEARRVRELVQVDTEAELEYFFLVGGPYNGLLVRRPMSAQDAVTLVIDPHEGYPEPIHYSFHDGELRYVEHSM